MKKMLFSAIAMVAFSVNSQAQTGILIVDISDSLDCAKKADNYARNQGMLTNHAFKAIRDAYYQGCMDGKKKDNGSNTHTKQNPTISK